MKMGLLETLLRDCKWFYLLVLFLGVYHVSSRCAHDWLRDGVFWRMRGSVRVLLR